MSLRGNSNAGSQPWDPALQSQCAFYRRAASTGFAATGFTWAFR